MLSSPASASFVEKISCRCESSIRNPCSSGTREPSSMSDAATFSASGAFVPTAGEYHFSFSYWPRLLAASLWISAMGLALLGFWMGWEWKLGRNASTALRS